MQTWQYKSRTGFQTTLKVKDDRIVSTTPSFLFGKTLVEAKFLARREHFTITYLGKFSKPQKTFKFDL